MLELVSDNLRGSSFHLRNIRQAKWSSRRDSRTLKKKKKKKCPQRNSTSKANDLTNDSRLRRQHVANCQTRATVIAHNCLIKSNDRNINKIYGQSRRRAVARAYITPSISLSTANIRFFALPSADGTSPSLEKVSTAIAFTRYLLIVTALLRWHKSAATSVWVPSGAREPSQTERERTGSWLREGEGKAKGGGVKPKVSRRRRGCPQWIIATATGGWMLRCTARRAAGFAKSERKALSFLRGWKEGIGGRIGGGEKVRKNRRQAAALARPHAGLHLSRGWASAIVLSVFG